MSDNLTTPTVVAEYDHGVVWIGETDRLRRIKVSVDDARSLASWIDLLRETPQSIEPGSTLLSEDEVSHILNVSRSMVRRLRHDGKLKCVRVGKHVRFQPQAVVDFIDSAIGYHTPEVTA